VFRPVTLKQRHLLSVADGAGAALVAGEAAAESLVPDLPLPADGGLDDLWA